MKQKFLFLLLTVSLLLTGCGLFEGSYVHVTPHLEQSGETKTEVISAANYRQLRSVVEAMVGQGVESGVINVADFDQDLVEKHMEATVAHIRETYPVGAYAVEDITYEIGTSSGRPAIAVTISYRHSRIEIQRIRSVRTMENAQAMIGTALDNREAGIVLEVEQYAEVDYSQIVEDYAQLHPDTVMETPQIAAAICRRREEAPIKTTLELVDIIRSAMPAAALREKQHPAKRSFQAIRIAVNDELGAVEKIMADAVDLLNPGGRLAVITFHSLEDRIVKTGMNDAARGCTCPPNFPVCVCGKKPKVKLVTRKPIIASEQELEDNPSSRSAKLRVCEKL